MIGDVSQWLNSLPPLTKIWFEGTAILSLIGRFALINPYYLILDSDGLIYGFHFWRLVTCVFFHPISFYFLVHMYFMYQYSLRLETGHFVGKPADYLFMLLFSWTCSLIVGLIGGMTVLMVPMVISVMYLWCQLNKEVVVSFWFGTRFKAMYLPWVLFLFDFIVNRGGIATLIGIFIGHLYYFLTIKYPQDFGGAPLLQTPQILYNLMANQRVTSGFGPAPVPPRAGGRQAGEQGGIGGMFRGQGHRLG